MKNNLLSKFVGFSLGSWIGMFIGALTVPFLTHFFSPEEFGVASLFFTAINLSGTLVLLGLDQTYVRFYYEESPSQLLKRCILIIGAFYLLISILVILFKDTLFPLFFNKLDSNYVYLLLFVLIPFVFNMFSSLTLRMEQKSIIFSLHSLIFRLLEFVLIIICFYCIGSNFNSIISARVLAYLLSALFGIWFCRKIWYMTIKQNLDAGTNVKSLLLYSWPVSCTFVMSTLMQSIDRFSIKRWGTFADLGIYASALNIIGIIQIVQATFSIYWTPLLLEKLVKSPNSQDNISFFTTVHEIITAVTLLLLILVTLFRDIIVHILGESYYTAAALVPVLAFMPVMNVIKETTKMGLVLYKKVHLELMISFIACSINLFMNLYFVSSYGIKGAALATGLTYIIYMIVQTFFSLRYYKIRFSLLKLFLVVLICLSYSIYQMFFELSFYGVLAGVLIMSLILFIYYKPLKVANCYLLNILKKG